MRFNRMILPLSIAPLLLAATSAPLPAQPPPPAPGERPARAETAVSAEQAMNQINRNLRRLQRQAADSTKKVDNLKLVNEAQRGAVSAKGAIPRGPWSEETDAAKQAQALEPYRRHLIALTRKLLDLEVAILDGKNEDATTLLADIQTLKLEAHKEMGIKDDD